MVLSTGNKTGSRCSKPSRWRSLAAAAVLGLCPFQEARAGEVLKFGLPLPLGVEASPGGTYTLNGSLLAAKLVKEAGGPALRLVARDTHGDAEAVAAADKLVKGEGIEAVVGPLTSEAVIRVADEVTVTAGLPLITPTASSPDIAELKDDDLVFRTAFTDDAEGAALAGTARGRGWRKVGIVYVGSLSGQGLSKAFRRYFEAEGNSVPAMVPMLRGQASYRSEIQKALDGAPEALLVAAPAAEAFRILKQAREMSPATGRLLPYALRQAAASAATGWEEMEGALGVMPVQADPQRQQEFDGAYRRMFGEAPDQFHAGASFDAVVLLALAAARGGKLDGSGLRDNLRSVAGPPGEKVDFTSLPRAMELLAAGADIDYDGVSGRLDFDQYGDPSPPAFSQWTVEGGKLKELRP